MINPQKRPITMMIRALDASGELLEIIAAIFISRYCFRLDGSLYMLGIIACEINFKALLSSHLLLLEIIACGVSLKVLLSNQRLELPTPVESKRELRSNFAESGIIVPNLTKYFQLYFSRCTAGLNRASNAIAIVFICDTSDSLTKYKAQICKSTCSHSVGWFVCKVSQVALRGM
jgi:hypothetical protein